MTLSLQEGVLYGPVASRRLGRSLGINLSPRRRKLCSFDCVYCHYGRTVRLTMDCAAHVTDLPSADDVLAQVELALAGPLELDVLTFSGNGEPTLHPQFAAIVDGVLELRDRLRPATPVVLLTNSSLLPRDEVRDAVNRLDQPICKLDVGTEAGFRAINRPAPGVTLEAVSEALAGMESITLQTLLAAGEPGNFDERELEAYLGRVHSIRPRAVQIYSIDRPVPERGLEKVDPDDLASFADRASQATEVPFRAYSPRDVTAKLSRSEAITG